MRWIAVAAMLAGSIVSVGQAEAKGCIKGALAGGVAGHFAGHHGLMGAAAGCAIGHHYANKQPKNAQGATDPNTNTTTQTAPTQ